MMVIKNYEEKGLYEFGLNYPLGTNTEGFYITTNKEFFVSPSIWSSGKWSIIPATPEVTMKINLERFEGNEEEVLNKLKEWTV